MEAEIAKWESLGDVDVGKKVSVRATAMSMLSMRVSDVHNAVA